MKLRKIGVVMLALLLAAMVIVPMVSAEKNMAGKIIQTTASPEQVAKINELWGKDITVGEYFTQVSPELLVDMPADIKAQLFKKKWVWPTTQVSGTATQPNSPLTVPITGMGSLNKRSTLIHFAGMATITGNTPRYMAFTTYLVNSADLVKASTSNSGYSVTYLNSDNLWVPDASGSYHTHTTAFSLTPDYDAVPYDSTSMSWP
jgi:hypothetical protein